MFYQHLSRRIHSKEVEISDEFQKTLYYKQSFFFNKEKESTWFSVIKRQNIKL